MKIPKCKGARDLMPEEMQRFSRIKAVFRKCCSSWGYKEIRTPTIEYLHLFTSAGTLTPEMLSRVYSFLDWDGWSGERVVLRPDGTIPSARFYVEHLSHLPVARLCYIENVFSFEGSGQESRERWQCGAELIGGREPEGDAELIMLALEVMDELFVSPVNVKLSHVGFYKGLMEALGVEETKREERLRQILSGDTSVLSAIQDQPEDIQRFLKLLGGLRGKSLGFLANLNAILPPSLSRLRPYLDDLAQVAELLDGIGQDYEIDFTAGKGFEYYTGIVFQFYSEDILLGNGGRYDELIRLVGGRDAPASGFALSIDSLLPLIYHEDPAAPSILLTQPGKEHGNMKPLFDLARELRRKGHTVMFDFGRERASDCRWIVRLEGDSETGGVALRDTKTGREWKGLTLNDLLDTLGRHHSRTTDHPLRDSN